MTSPLKVLIADDSSTVRRLVSTMLETDSDLEIVGSVSNGEAAVKATASERPDVVLLDVEMPVMDGLDAVRLIRQEHPTLPVIMLSALTQRGAAVTLEALFRGATAYIAKPTATEGLQPIREKLIKTIKVLCHRAPDVEDERLEEVRRRRVRKEESKGPRIAHVVAIGASMGGPRALATILTALRANMDAPVIVVQHMPPLFTAKLANTLESMAEIAIKEAHTGEVLESGTVYIAPGDRHLVVDRVSGIPTLRTTHDPPVNSCRPAVDVLLESVADVYRSRSLAVILTGMGQDGLRGCLCIDNAGGQILVQDEASSLVPQMPRAVAQAGLANDIVPLDAMARAILRRVRLSTPGGSK